MDAHIMSLMAMGAAALPTGNLGIRSCINQAAETYMSLTFIGMLNNSELVFAFKRYVIRQASFLLREQSMCLWLVNRPP